MIVTAGAGDGQTEETFSKHIDLVVHMVGLVLLHISRGVSGLVKIPETRAKNRLIELLFRVASGLSKQITGNMFRDELVIWQIRIVGPDQVVAVFKSKIQRVIELMAVGFGVAN